VATRLSRAGLVLAAGLVAFAPVALAQPAPTIADVVKAHLDWLAQHNNYTARVEQHIGDKTFEGTLVVDLLRQRIVYSAKSPRLPQGVELKVTNLDAGGFLVALSRGVGRPDDLPVFVSNETPSPFKEGSWQLFQRGASLNETIAKLYMVATKVEPLPASDYGALGLRLGFDENLLQQLGRQMDKALGLEDEVKGERLEAAELWFAGDGRVEAARLFAKGNVLVSEGRFHYEQIDAPVAELAKQMPSGVAPAPATLQRPPAQPESPLDRAERVATPVLGSTWLIVLTVLRVRKNGSS
jgi:hypothetical protein